MKNAFRKKKQKYRLAAKYASPRLKRPHAGRVKYHRRRDMQ